METCCVFNVGYCHEPNVHTMHLFQVSVSWQFNAYEQYINYKKQTDVRRD